MPPGSPKLNPPPEDGFSIRCSTGIKKRLALEMMRLDLVRDHG
jgi:hypothetical protein